MTREELQKTLDEMALAFTTDDFGLYLSCVSVPFSILSGNGAKTYTTRQELHDMFDEYVVALRYHSVDKIVRVLKTFEDCHNDTWLCTVETHFFYGHRRIAEPHVSALLAEDASHGPRVTAILGTRNPQEAMEIAPIIWES